MLISSPVISGILASSMVSELDSAFDHGCITAHLLRDMLNSEGCK